MAWTYDDKYAAAQKAIDAASAASPAISAASRLGKAIKEATRQPSLVEGYKQGTREGNPRLAAQYAEYGIEPGGATVNLQKEAEDREVGQLAGQERGERVEDDFLQSAIQNARGRALMKEPLPTAPKLATSTPAARGRPARPKTPKKGATGARYEGG